MTHGIPNGNTLRQVYLMWLISDNPQQMLQENGLVFEQITRFQDIIGITWGQFIEARNKEIGE